jgi:RNA polymerase primary sigma factor
VGCGSDRILRRKQSILDAANLDGEKTLPIDTPDDPVAMYLREVANVQPLTRYEEAALFKELSHLDRRDPQRELAARRLIEGHLHAVLDIAEKYSSSGVPMLELLEEGNLGLMKAVDRFAEQPKGEFREFAATLIEEAIRACISQWE